MSATARQEPPTGQARPKRVLVVDDSAVDRSVLGHLLDRLGARYETAPDGLHGLLAACGGGFDLILLDLEMRNLDGLGAARRIRKALGDETPYLVAVTGHTSEADQQRCRDAGIDQVLGKPVSLHAVQALLGEARHAH